MNTLKHYKSVAIAGFTLIEMSIVLVIIGLIVGGILVGQNLIATAAIRATVSQIEKYNTATHTFQVKYGALPGDITPDLVTQFGFTVVPTRTGTRGRGDGSGLLEGYDFGASGSNGNANSGETAWFWEDLSANAGLIDGILNYATDAAYATNTSPSLVLPAAKIGNNNYVSIYASGNVNYFSISSPQLLSVNGYPYFGGTTPPGLSVSQAYGIDKKIDDGLPQSGRVIARYQNYTLAPSYSYTAIWAAGGGVVGASSGSYPYNPTTSSILGTSTTCYDNGGGSGVQQYSMAQNNGAGVNCALSIKFQ